jgi:hypothetical protein
MTGNKNRRCLTFTTRTTDDGAGDELRLGPVGSGDQAAPANFSRSTNSNVPVLGAIGGAGFQAAFRYR